MKKHLLSASILFGLFAHPAYADPFNIEAEVKPVPKAAVCTINTETEKLHLADIVNLALCRNPQTRNLYMGALAAAAEYGQTKADYLPELDFRAGISQSDTEVRHNRDSNSTTASAGINLSWLIYDFGGRNASTERVRQSLNAALATRSDTLQTLIFDAAEAYFKLLSAQEEYANSDADQASALAAFEAASTRYDLGLAAYSDKLQAETSYAQTQLNVAKAKETLELAKGNLAALLNYPPDKPLVLYEEQYPADYFLITGDADSLIKTALNSRADIAAKKAAVKQAESSLDYQKSQNAPSLNLSAGLNAQDEMAGKDRRSATSSVGLTLTVPLFTGFKNTYKASQAHYQLEQKKAELKQLENEIRQQVWNAFQSFQTAKKAYEISLTMFVSADQSANVALGAYKAGKGSILNVLDTQAKLASARSTKSSSYYDLLIAKITVIRKIGLIDPFQTNKGF